MIAVERETVEKATVLFGGLVLLAGLLKVHAQPPPPQCETACEISCQACEICEAGEVPCGTCETVCETTCETCEFELPPCETCEAGEVPSPPVPPIEIEMPPASVKRVSKMISFSKTIDGSYEVLREDTAGAIKELLFASPSDNYRIKVVLDGSNVYDDTFANLQSISSGLNDLAAYSSGGTYYLNITELYYLKSCVIAIETYENIAFSKLYIKYEVHEYA